MPIDFTLTPEQQRLRADARAFARDVLSNVRAATQDLATPLARFAATRPFYEQTVGTTEHVYGPSRPVGPRFWIPRHRRGGYPKSARGRRQ